MGRIKEPQKVLPFLGLIYGETFPVEELLTHLTREYGPILKRSPVIPFTHTTYYDSEMGTSLNRQWIAFERLIDPAELPALKLWTNDLEARTLTETGGRMVNIDPGLVTLSSLILASTKNYAHRIYLTRGIYAELTLVYKEHAFQVLEWTYPDYREKEVLRFFRDVRERLKNMLKEIGDN